jgi:sec-independent protein translocase protein TatB
MGIGFFEIVIIGLAAFILLGPSRLPEIMRQVARFYVQLRRTSNEFKSAFDHVVHEAEKDLQIKEARDLHKIGLEVSDLKSSIIEPPKSARPEKPFDWDGTKLEHETDSKRS